MFAERLAIWSYVERRAIQRPAVSLDDAHHHSERSRFCNIADCGGDWAWNLDSAICVSAKELSPRISSNTKGGTKGQRLWIASDKCLWKDRQFYVLLSALHAIAFKLFQCAACIA